jgi:hypothetical protein
MAALIFGSFPVSFLFVAARSAKASRAGARGLRNQRDNNLKRAIINTKSLNAPTDSLKN